MGNRGTLSFLSLSVPCPTVHQPFVLARLLTRLRSRRRNAAELQRVDRDENPGAATGGTHHLIEPVVATSTLSVLASGSPTRPLEREWRPKCNLVSAWRMVDPGTPLIRPKPKSAYLRSGSLPWVVPNRTLEPKRYRMFERQRQTMATREPNLSRRWRSSVAPLSHEWSGRCSRWFDPTLPADGVPEPACRYPGDSTGVEPIIGESSPRSTQERSRPVHR